MYELPSEIRAWLAEQMLPEEEILWMGRPIPKHVWTIIGTTYPRTRFIRAVSLLIFELFAFAILGIGLVLAAVFLDLAFGFRWTIPEIIGAALLAPFAVVVTAAGWQAIGWPRDMYQWAGVAHYLLTTHHTFIVWTDADEIRGDKKELALLQPAEVHRPTKSGVGDVIFATHIARLVDGYSGTTTAWSDLGFFAVANATEVAANVEHARSERCLLLYGKRGYGLDEMSARVVRRAGARS